MKIALTPIKSKRRILDAARFEAEIQKAVIESKNGIQADFKKTVATWNHKPKFYTTRRGDVWYIGTTDKIYGYVDKGTPPHEIKPKKMGGKLRFYRSGFKRKSRPGYIDSYAGKMATKDLTFSKGVHHPGTEARNFSQKIAEKWQKEFAKKMRAAIRKAANP